MVIDKNWFLSRMKRRDLTQRKAAKALGMDPGQMSRLLNGKRKMQLTEVPGFAKLLGEASPDVISAAGINMRSNKVAEGEMAIVGRVDSAGTVHMEAKPIGAIPDQHGCDNAVALRFESALTPLDPVDGWYVIVTEKPVSTDEAVGHMALCEMEDGSLRLCWLRKGYEPGRFRLTWVSPEMETASVISARPVLLIIPQQA